MGHPFSPLSDRMRAYEEVMRMVADGDTSPAAVRRSLTASGIRLPAPETVRRWIRGMNAPATAVNTFVPRPSEELSFFIGAWLGDGWADESDGGKRMLLKVRSYDFAREFSWVAAKLLGKASPNWVRRVNDAKGRWYLAKVTSVMLYEFISQPQDALLEVARAHPDSFLRGFFTAEGCPAVSIERRNPPHLGVGLVLANSDASLLEFVRALLVQLGYRPGIIRVNTLKGEKTNLGVATRPGLLLNMSRRNDIARFLSEIGFADSVKQSKLSDAVRLVNTLGSSGAVREWVRLYRKVGKRWERDVEQANA